jgi:hypothetical protein
LIFLSFPVSLPQLTFLPMKHVARQAVPAFVPVQLRQTVAAIIGIRDVVQQVQRFGNSPQIADGAAQSRDLVARCSPRINSDGLTVPIFREPATRRNSSHFSVIKELRKDVTGLGPDRQPQTDLTRPLRHRYQHDVHDPPI